VRRCGSLVVLAMNNPWLGHVDDRNVRTALVVLLTSSSWALGCAKDPGLDPSKPSGGSDSDGDQAGAGNAGRSAVSAGGASAGRAREAGGATSTADQAGAAGQSIPSCTGCYIDGECHAKDTLSPDNPCAVCTPALARDAWSRARGPETSALGSLLAVTKGGAYNSPGQELRTTARVGGPFVTSPSVGMRCAYDF
jgi:hypothetical protein